MSPRLTPVTPGDSSPAVDSFPFNRLRDVLLHVPWYTFEAGVRLAEDAGISSSTISRIVNRRYPASVRIARAIAAAISWRRGTEVVPPEIFSQDGTYPTASVCALLGCHGCLPPEAYDERSDLLKSDWRGARPGDWCRYPSPAPPMPIDLIHRF